MPKFSSFASCLLVFGTLACSTSSQAASLNLNDWTSLGDVITQTNQAFMTNAFADGADDSENLNVSGNDPVQGFDVELELGLADGSLGLTAGDTSTIIQQTLNANSGDRLLFDWNFNTNHTTFDSNRNDYAFISINGTIITLADTATAASSPGINNFAQQTGEVSFSYEFTESNQYTIGIGVVDVGDNITSSGLLIENIRLETDGVIVPEPSTLFGSILLFSLGVSIRKK